MTTIVNSQLDGEGSGYRDIDFVSTAGNFTVNNERVTLLLIQAGSSPASEGVVITGQVPEFSGASRTINPPAGGLVIVSLPTEEYGEEVNIFIEDATDISVAVVEHDYTVPKISNIVYRDRLVLGNKKTIRESLPGAAEGAVMWRQYASQLATTADAYDPAIPGTVLSPDAPPRVFHALTYVQDDLTASLGNPPFGFDSYTASLERFAAVGMPHYPAFRLFSGRYGDSLFLNYNGASGTFVEGETLSGASGSYTLVDHEVDNGATGRMRLTPNSPTNNPTSGEVLTGGTSGATLSANGAGIGSYFDRSIWERRATVLSALADLRPEGEFRVGFDREDYPPTNFSAVVRDAEYAAVGRTEADLIFAMQPMLDVIREKKIYPCIYPYFHTVGDRVKFLIMDAAEYAEAWGESGFGPWVDNYLYDFYDPSLTSSHLGELTGITRDIAKLAEDLPHVDYRCGLFDDYSRQWGYKARQNSASLGVLPPWMFDSIRVAPDQTSSFTEDWFTGAILDPRNDVLEAWTIGYGASPAFHEDTGLPDDQLRLYNYPGLTLNNDGLDLVEPPVALPSGALAWRETDNNKVLRRRAGNGGDNWQASANYTVSFSFMMNDIPATSSVGEYAYIGGPAKRAGSGAGRSWYWRVTDDGAGGWDLWCSIMTPPGTDVHQTIVAGYTPGDWYRLIVTWNGTQVQAHAVDSAGNVSSGTPVTGYNTYNTLYLGSVAGTEATVAAEMSRTLWFAGTYLEAAHVWTAGEIADARPGDIWPYGRS